LIHETQVLIVVVGNNSNLIIDTDIDTYYIMDALINKIPAASDYLSDIRNYGAAAAVQGKLTSSDRTRLTILTGLARAELQAQQMGLGYIATHNADLSAAISAIYDAANVKLNEYLDTVDSVLLGGSGELSQDTPLNVDSQSYFNNGSTAIDAMFAYYDMLQSKENDLLQARVARIIVQRNAVGALSVAALLLAIYLCIAFFLGIKGVINSLDAASQRLISGHAGEALVLDNRDELAQVVISFNNVAREMILARDRLLEQHTLTEALLDSAMTISSTLKLDEVIDQILSDLRRVTRYDVANIMIVEDVGVLVLGERRFRDSDIVMWPQRRLPATDEHYPGSKSGSAMPIITGSGVSSPPFEDVSSLKSYLFLPIVLGQSIIGYINLGCEEADYFAHHHTAYLQIFALQAGSAIQNAQLYKQARILSAMEERQRLARDLHDSVSQILFSTNMMAEALPRLMAQNPDKARDYLYDIREMTHSAMIEMKSLLVELQSETLSKSDLGMLLNHLADSLVGKTIVKVEKNLQRQVILPPEVQFVFYRVAQEAISNIAKHANATQVTISLQFENNVCTLKIGDNGTGFDPTGTSGNLLGLRIMKERAQEVQASLLIDSGAGQGTHISLSKQLQ
jgi:signal transduction histidine kinase